MCSFQLYELFVIFNPWICGTRPAASKVHPSSKEPALAVENWEGALDVLLRVTSRGILNAGRRGAKPGE